MKKESNIYQLNSIGIDRIKLRAMKEELKKRVTNDNKDRYTFGILEGIKTSLQH
jgi:hypothetical protein